MLLLTNFCYAETVQGLGIGDLNNYNPVMENGYEKVSTKAGAVLGLIQVIGTVVSVIVLMVIGIKYMVSSVQERAEYKKTFILYIVGVFLIFTGTLLPKLIYDLSTQVFK